MRELENIGEATMDKLVRKIEVPLAKKAIADAGLYLAGEKDMERLAEVSMEVYRGYIRWCRTA